MSNFCIKCGSQLQPGVRFCNNCGTMVGSQPIAGQQSQNQGYTHPNQFTVNTQYTPQNQNQPTPPNQYEAINQYTNSNQYETTNRYTNSNQYAASNQYANQNQYVNQNLYAASNQYPNAAQYAAGPVANRTPRKHTGARVLAIVMAVVLVVVFVVAGWWYPGFFVKEGSNGGNTGKTAENKAGNLNGGENSGGKDISSRSLIDEEGIELVQYDAASEPTGLSELNFDLKHPVSEASTLVSTENPACTVGGVEIEFDDFCLSEVKQTVGVASFGVKDDGEYMAEAYDITLDGSGAELASEAKITLPYNPEWGKNVFVQYFNPETGSWEILYTEVEEAGKATFYTDHFCEFAVFVRMVLDDSMTLSEDGPVIYYTGEGLDIHAEVNYAALANQLRQKLTNGDLSSISSGSEAYYRELATESLLGNASDTTSTALSTFLGDSAAGKLFSGYGMCTTVAKIMRTYIQKGDLKKTLSKHQGDLASLAVSAVGLCATGAVASFCSAASIVLTTYSVMDSQMSDISYRGMGSTANYAYREFSEQYITYNLSTGRCGVNYTKDLVGRVKAEQTPFPDSFALPCPQEKSVINLSGRPDNSYCYAQWKKIFKYVSSNYGVNAPKKMDNIITQYTSIFWNLDSYSPGTLNNFLNNTRDGRLSTEMLAKNYQRPDDEQIRLMKEQFRYEIYSRLEPYINQMMRNAYHQLLNEAYNDAAKLAAELNRKITFKLVDSSVENFAESIYTSVELALEGDLNHVSWPFNSENNWQIVCTRAAYIQAECPSTFYVFGDTKISSRHQTIKLAEPVTYINVDEGEEEVEFIADGIDAFMGTWCEPDGTRWILMRNGDLVVDKSPDLPWFAGDVCCCENTARFDPETNSLILKSTVSWVSTVETLYTPDLDNRPLLIDASGGGESVIKATKIENGLVVEIQTRTTTLTRGD